MTRSKAPSQIQPRRKPAEGTQNHDVRDHVLLVAFMVAITLCAIFYAVPIMLQETHDELALKSHGVDGTAVVVSTRRVSGRSSSTYYATFAFRRPTDASEIVDEAKVSRHEYYGIQAGTRATHYTRTSDPSRLGLLGRAPIRALACDQPGAGYLTLPMSSMGPELS